MHILSSVILKAFCGVCRDRQSASGNVNVLMRSKLFEAIPPACVMLPHPDTWAVVLPLKMLGCKAIVWTLAEKTMLVAV